jgi:ABC-type multidrug transport system fused ATPase/permease subunit
VDKDKDQNAYGWAFFLLAAMLLGSLAQHMADQSKVAMVLQIRALLRAAVYNKSFVVLPQYLHTTPGGDGGPMKLLLQDAEDYATLLPLKGGAAVLMGQCLGILVWLGDVLGYGAWSYIAFMFLYYLLAIWVSGAIYRAMRVYNRSRHKRVQLTAECAAAVHASCNVDGYRVTSNTRTGQAIDPTVLDRLQRLRDAELHWLHWANQLRSFFGAITLALPVMIICFALVIHHFVYTTKFCPSAASSGAACDATEFVDVPQLDTATVLVTIALVALLRQPLQLLYALTTNPNYFGVWNTFSQSKQRLWRFLLAEETNSHLISDNSARGSRRQGNDFEFTRVSHGEVTITQYTEEKGQKGQHEYKLQKHVGVEINELVSMLETAPEGTARTINLRNRLNELQQMVDEYRGTIEPEMRQQLEAGETISYTEKQGKETFEVRFEVTVSSDKKFFELDGDKGAGSPLLFAGNKYIFDQSHPSNQGFPLRFCVDRAKEDVLFNEGGCVTHVGQAGEEGAEVTLIVPSSLLVGNRSAALWYTCPVQKRMCRAAEPMDVRPWNAKDHMMKQWQLAKLLLHAEEQQMDEKLQQIRHKHEQIVKLESEMRERDMQVAEVKQHINVTSFIGNILDQNAAAQDAGTAEAGTGKVAMEMEQQIAGYEQELKQLRGQVGDLQRNLEVDGTRGRVESQQRLVNELHHRLNADWTSVNYTEQDQYAPSAVVDDTSVRNGSNTPGEFAIAGNIDPSNRMPMSDKLGRKVLEMTGTRQYWYSNTKPKQTSAKKKYNLQQVAAPIVTTTAEKVEQEQWYVYTVLAEAPKSLFTANKGRAGYKRDEGGALVRINLLDGTLTRVPDGKSKQLPDVSSDELARRLGLARCIISWQGSIFMLGDFGHAGVARLDSFSGDVEFLHGQGTDCSHNKEWSDVRVVALLDGFLYAPDHEGLWRIDLVDGSCVRINSEPGWAAVRGIVADCQVGERQAPKKKLYMLGAFAGMRIVDPESGLYKSVKCSCAFEVPVPTVKIRHSFSEQGATHTKTEEVDNIVPDWTELRTMVVLDGCIYAPYSGTQPAHRGLWRLDLRNASYTRISKDTQNARWDTTTGLVAHARIGSLFAVGNFAGVRCLSPNSDSGGEYVTIGSFDHRVFQHEVHTAGLSDVCAAQLHHRLQQDKHGLSVGDMLTTEARREEEGYAYIPSSSGIWKVRLQDGSFKLINNNDWSGADGLVAYDGKLFLLGQSGVRCVDATNGTNRVLLDTNQTDEQTQWGSSKLLAVALLHESGGGGDDDAAIYAVCEDGLWCMSTRTGLATKIEVHDKHTNKVLKNSNAVARQANKLLGGVFWKWGNVRAMVAADDGLLYLIGDFPGVRRIDVQSEVSDVVSAHEHRHGGRRWADVKAFTHMRGTGHAFAADDQGLWRINLFGVWMKDESGVARDRLFSRGVVTTAVVDSLRNALPTNADGSSCLPMSVSGNGANTNTSSASTSTGSTSSKPISGEIYIGQPVNVNVRGELLPAIITRTNSSNATFTVAYGLRDGTEEGDCIVKPGSHTLVAAAKGSDSVHEWSWWRDGLVQGMVGSSVLGNLPGMTPVRPNIAVNGPPGGGEASRAVAASAGATSFGQYVVMRQLCVLGDFPGVCVIDPETGHHVIRGQHTRHSSARSVEGGDGPGAHWGEFKTIAVMMNRELDVGAMVQGLDSQRRRILLGTDTERAHRRAQKEQAYEDRELHGSSPAHSSRVGALFDKVAHASPFHGMFEGAATAGAAMVVHRGDVQRADLERYLQTHANRPDMVAKVDLIMQEYHRSFGPDWSAALRRHLGQKYGPEPFAGSLVVRSSDPNASLGITEAGFEREEQLMLYTRELNFNQLDSVLAVSPEGQQLMQDQGFSIDRLQLQLVSATNLLAGDYNLTSRNTSDPYITVKWGRWRGIGDVESMAEYEWIAIGQTARVEQTLSPNWAREHFELPLGTMSEGPHSLGEAEKPAIWQESAGDENPVFALHLVVYDHDHASQDDMLGQVLITSSPRSAQAGNGLVQHIRNCASDPKGECTLALDERDTDGFARRTRNAKLGQLVVKLGLCDTATLVSPPSKVSRTHGSKRDESLVKYEHSETLAVLDSPRGGRHEAHLHSPRTLPRSPPRSPMTMRRTPQRAAGQSARDLVFVPHRSGLFRIDLDTGAIEKVNALDWGTHRGIVEYKGHLYLLGEFEGLYRLDANTGQTLARLNGSDPANSWRSGTEDANWGPVMCRLGKHIFLPRGGHHPALWRVDVITGNYDIVDSLQAEAQDIWLGVRTIVADEDNDCLYMLGQFCGLIRIKDPLGQFPRFTILGALGAAVFSHRVNNAVSAEWSKDGRINQNQRQKTNRWPDVFTATLLNGQLFIPTSEGLWRMFVGSSSADDTGYWPMEQTSLEVPANTNAVQRISTVAEVGVPKFVPFGDHSSSEDLVWSDVRGLVVGSDDRLYAMGAFYGVKRVTLSLSDDRLVISKIESLNSTTDFRFDHANQWGDLRGIVHVTEHTDAVGTVISAESAAAQSKSPYRQPTMHVADMLNEPSRTWGYEHVLVKEVKVEEKESKVVEEVKIYRGVKVTIQDGHFIWGKGRTHRDHGDFFAIGAGAGNHINFNAEGNDLVIVAGFERSGKSSLLHALLGNMLRMSGQVVTQGQVVYCPTQPWIFNASFKTNIVMAAAGVSMSEPADDSSIGQAISSSQGPGRWQAKDESGEDESWYHTVVDLCELRDLRDRISGGDQALLGAGGYKLSHCERQRISLARALYQKADIYLLDDVFRGMAKPMAHKLFQEVVVKKMKERGPVVLVSNDSFLIKEGAEGTVVSDEQLQTRVKRSGHRYDPPRDWCVHVMESGVLVPWGSHVYLERLEVLRSPRWQRLNGVSKIREATHIPLSQALQYATHDLCSASGAALAVEPMGLYGTVAVKVDDLITGAKNPLQVWSAIDKEEQAKVQARYDEVHQKVVDAEYAPRVIRPGLSGLDDDEFGGVEGRPASAGNADEGHGCIPVKACCAKVRLPGQLVAKACSKALAAIGMKRAPKSENPVEELPVFSGEGRMLPHPVAAKLITLGSRGGEALQPEQEGRPQLPPNPFHAGLHDVLAYLSRHGLGARGTAGWVLGHLFVVGGAALVVGVQVHVSTKMWGGKSLLQRHEWYSSAYGVTDTIDQLLLLTIGAPILLTVGFWTLTALAKATSAALHSQLIHRLHRNTLKTSGFEVDHDDKVWSVETKRFEDAATFSDHSRFPTAALQLLQCADTPLQHTDEHLLPELQSAVQGYAMLFLLVLAVLGSTDGIFIVALPYIALVVLYIWRKHDAALRSFEGAAIHGANAVARHAADGFAGLSLTPPAALGGYASLTPSGGPHNNHDGKYHCGGDGVSHGQGPLRSLGGKRAVEHVLWFGGTVLDREYRGALACASVDTRARLWAEAFVAAPVVFFVAFLAASRMDQVIESPAEGSSDHGAAADLESYKTQSCLALVLALQLGRLLAEIWAPAASPLPPRALDNVSSAHASSVATVAAAGGAGDDGFGSHRSCPNGSLSLGHLWQAMAQSGRAFRFGENKPAAGWKKDDTAKEEDDQEEELHERQHQSELVCRQFEKRQRHRERLHRRRNGCCHLVGLVDTTFTTIRSIAAMIRSKCCRKNKWRSKDRDRSNIRTTKDHDWEPPPIGECLLVAVRDITLRADPHAKHGLRDFKFSLPCVLEPGSRVALVGEGRRELLRHMLCMERGDGVRHQYAGGGSNSAGGSSNMGQVGNSHTSQFIRLHVLDRISDGSTNLVQGHELIQAVESGSLPLSLLWRRVAYVPSSPLLFRGSLVHNLFPGIGADGPSHGQGCCCGDGSSNTAEERFFETAAGQDALAYALELLRTLGLASDVADVNDLLEVMVGAGGMSFYVDSKEDDSTGWGGSHTAKSNKVYNGVMIAIHGEIYKTDVSSAAVLRDMDVLRSANARKVGNDAAGVPADVSASMDEEAWQRRKWDENQSAERERSNLTTTQEDRIDDETARDLDELDRDANRVGHSDSDWRSHHHEELADDAHALSVRFRICVARALLRGVLGRKSSGGAGLDEAHASQLDECGNFATFANIEGNAGLVLIDEGGYSVKAESGGKGSRQVATICESTARCVHAALLTSPPGPVHSHLRSSVIKQRYENLTVITATNHALVNQSFRPAPKNAAAAATERSRACCWNNAEASRKKTKYDQLHNVRDVVKTTYPFVGRIVNVEPYAPSFDDNAAKGGVQQLFAYGTVGDLGPVVGAGTGAPAPFQPIRTPQMAAPPN